MTPLQVSLPNDLKEFVERKVASGSFHDADEYLRSLVERASVEEARERLEALVLEGIEDIEAGNGVEMTPEDWKQMREEYLERMRSRNGS